MTTSKTMVMAMMALLSAPTGTQGSDEQDPDETIVWVDDNVSSRRAHYEESGSESTEPSKSAGTPESTGPSESTEPLGEETLPSPKLLGPKLFGDSQTEWFEDISYTAWGDSLYLTRTAARFGWWALDTTGDKTKTGEFQSLESSPFWDVDGLLTDGERTVDFFGTGLTSEDSQAGLRYFGPRLSAKVGYQRYLRNLDHDPLSNITDFQQQTPGGELIIKEDLNTGEDYAIRVQELKVNFKGRLTDNIRWRLNLWGMRKKGERQVNAMAHCFNHPGDTDINGVPVGGISCHVLSQRQQIDWITAEIEPVISGHFENITVEYSRTMRSFSQNDEATTRPYDNFGFAGDLPYAVVPDNYTEIDRVKINVDLMERLDLYARLYNGNTINRFRDTNRRFRGFDVRLTDWSLDGFKLTGYAKRQVQTGQTPSVLLAEENVGDFGPQINYDRTTAGIKARWRPFYDDYCLKSALAITGGYEYRLIQRENAVFTDSGVPVNEEFTTTNMLHTGASMRWNSAIDSYVRYKLRFTDDPLYPIAENGTTNTALPTQEHLVEIGGTWTPADNFLMSATFGFLNRWNSSAVASFEEDDYPITFTAWYAPTSQWSISGGLAYYSNWINQQITLGPNSTPDTSLWNYGGRSQVINVGTTYAWTDWLSLSGGFEFVRGRNTFDSPALWPDLPQYSDVIVETTRWTGGVDYVLGENTTCYFRYQFFDFEDKSEDFNSGTANMFLAGMTALF